jgi:hypothetical protein
MPRRQSTTETCPRRGSTACTSAPDCKLASLPPRQSSPSSRIGWWPMRELIAQAVQPLQTGSVGLRRIHLGVGVGSAPSLALRRRPPALAQAPPQTAQGPPRDARRLCAGRQRGERAFAELDDRSGQDGSPTGDSRAQRFGGTPRCGSPSACPVRPPEGTAHRIAASRRWPGAVSTAVGAPRGVLWRGAGWRCVVMRCR